MLNSLTGLEDTRKCWRLVNGVLFEKTKAELVPELQGNISNMENIIKQMSDTLQVMKQDILRLEQ